VGEGGGCVPEEGEVGELIVSDLGEEVVLQVQNLQLAQPVQRPASDLERCIFQRKRSNFFVIRENSRKSYASMDFLLSVCLYLTRDLI
jgi:hypothetical protein